ncbi:MAG: hypothetical protein ACNYPD_00570 [Candidatus Halichondribacter symbioticus]
MILGGVGRAWVNGGGVWAGSNGSLSDPSYGIMSDYEGLRARGELNRLFIAATSCLYSVYLNVNGG